MGFVPVKSEESQTVPVVHRVREGGRAHAGGEGLERTHLYRKLRALGIDTKQNPGDPAN
ncbi:MAG: hypothetical protein ACREXS_15650 [Gammaproteobacteria bacterium]